MNLKEANERLKVKISEEQLQKLNSLYLLLDLHKDYFCKIVNSVGIDTLLERSELYDRSLQAREEFEAKERYLWAKTKLQGLEEEKKKLEKIINDYPKI